MERAWRIDALQYANWSPRIFDEMRLGGVDAVHVTLNYHETFRETVAVIERWNSWFEQHPEHLLRARSGDDVRRARAEGKTGIVFGLQNPSAIEDDIGLVEVLHALGVRFMQLSYNNQSLLAAGCYEDDDAGLTRMGRAVVREMNRVGMVVDMSHSGERSTLEAIARSTRPIAITHANPKRWAPALRNKSDRVLRALAESGGMLGLSLYPHHLRDKSACTLDSFCRMVMATADRLGVHHVGIGSDLCQDQPDRIVGWMRNGRWTKEIDHGEGSPAAPGFPPMPPWFQDNRDLATVEQGLRDAGFAEPEVRLVMGENWLRFFDASFTPERSRPREHA